MQTADAVVIGAGINGAATAYNLIKRAGIKNVVLLEKQLIASGGTGRSAAIIRQHYSNEELVRMVKRSVDGFFLCAGFSGHGFKIAPAIGEVMAEEIIDGAAHSIDIERLNLRRFAAEALIGAAYGSNRA